MKEYEVACTYLNGCSGAAYPQITFEEVAVERPEDYIRAKHGKNAERFVPLEREDGRPAFLFDTGAVKYIYEFTEL